MKCKFQFANNILFRWEKRYCSIRPNPHVLLWSNAAGSARLSHKVCLKSHQSRNMSIAVSRFFYVIQWEYRRGVCPLTLCMSFSLVPPRARADKDGGFAVWFGSLGSIDSFKVESTCHCFNHLWPRLHVGRTQRGTGSAAPYVLSVCVGAVKRKKEKNI